MNNSRRQLLGLCYRAGKLLLGESALHGLGTGKVKLLLIASDASPLTFEKATNKANFYLVKFLRTLAKAELGMALNKTNIAIIGITDVALAKKYELIQED